jgi:hypothetical protein
MKGNWIDVQSSEIYGAARKLGVKVHDWVWSYVKVYTVLYQYIQGYANFPEAWSAHRFFHFWRQDTMQSAWEVTACMIKHQNNTLKYEKSGCPWK